MRCPPVLCLAVVLAAAGAARAAEPVCLHPLNTAGVQSHPRVAAAAGSVIVVWDTTGDVHHDVSAAVSRDGGATFQGPIVVNDDGTATDQMEPDVAVSAAGDAFVVWQDRRSGGTDPFGGNFDVYISKLAGDASAPAASKCVHADEKNGAQTRPRVATPEAGNPVVVWQDNRLSEAKDSSTRWEVRMTYSLDGWTSFAAPKTISSSSAAFKTNAAVAAAPTGTNFRAVWYDWDALGVYRDFEAPSLPGNGEKKVDDGASSQMLKPSAVFAPGGVWIVWQDTRDTGASADPSLVAGDWAYWDVYARFFPSDGGVTVPLRLNKEAKFNQYQPAACGDGTRAFVCYSDNSALSHYRVRCGELTQGGLAGDREIAPAVPLLGPIVKDQLWPSCAFDGKNLHVVWEQERPDGDADVYYSSVPPDAFGAAPRKWGGK
jgi:hypothetical protein